MPKAVTLKDIADRLQISIVTVSNALADRSGVGEDLKKKILDVAQEMGYQRKPRREKQTLPKSRMYHAGKRIGVVALESHLKRNASFYWELYQHVVIEASKMGCFVLLELLTQERVEQKEMPLLIREEQIDALILLGVVPKDYVCETYAQAGVPVLLLDTDYEENPCDAVISNGFVGMYQMTNYLISQGHQKIGFVGEYRATRSIMDRYQGYYKSLLEHGIRENHNWLLSDRRLMEPKQEAELPKVMPTAFACSSDLAADLMAQRLIRAGYRVPEDISLVGFDDFLAEGILQGRITTYAVDMDAMAHQALKLLTKRLDGDKQAKMVRTIDGRVIIRDTVKEISDGQR